MEFSRSTRSHLDPRKSGIFEAFREFSASERQIPVKPSIRSGPWCILADFRIFSHLRNRLLCGENFPDDGRKTVIYRGFQRFCSAFGGNRQTVANSDDTCSDFVDFMPFSLNCVVGWLVQFGQSVQGIIGARLGTLMCRF